MVRHIKLCRIIPAAILLLRDWMRGGLQLHKRCPLMSGERPPPAHPPADPDARNWRNDALSRLSILERKCDRRSSCLSPRAATDDEDGPPNKVRRMCAASGACSERLATLRAIVVDYTPVPRELTSRLHLRSLSSSPVDLTSENQNGTENAAGRQMPCL